MRCALCGRTSESNVACVNSHYICDACHSLPATDFITRYSVTSEVKDPLEQAVALMRDPRVAMHGPEHHFLVPAVLLSAYYNMKSETALKEEKIRVAQKRAAAVPGGFCGFHGDCGAGVGVGIFVSVMTGSTPLSVKEWRLSNLATGKSLITIAESGGPRCCKRNTYLAIGEAVQFVDEHFSISLPIKKDIECEFTDLNKQCIKERCRFHKNKRQTPNKNKLLQD